jgi:hypothetical protein
VAPRAGSAWGDPANLGTADSFAALAGTGITNDGDTRSDALYVAKRRGRTRAAISTSSDMTAGSAFPALAVTTGVCL